MFGRLTKFDSSMGSTIFRLDLSMGLLSIILIINNEKGNNEDDCF